MRHAPALALVALLLAGCASPANDGNDDAPSTGPARFLAPQDLGPGGPEPILAFAPEGTHLYVAAQDAQGKGPRVWISKDGGVTFTMRRVTTEGGGEVDLAAGPDGAVYLTQLGTRGNLVSVSRDHGDTWQTAPLGGASQYFDREWLAVDAQGRVYLVAREFGQTASAGVARSDDRGLTFPPRGKAWTALDEAGNANGNLLAVGTAVHLVYICREGEGVCIATSDDGGITWRQNLIAQRPLSVANVYPALAATSRGLVAIWSDATHGALAVYTSTSADGETWSAPQRITPDTGTATLPWIAARGDTLWAVYLHTDAALLATDCSPATQAAWRPTALRLHLDGTPTAAPQALTDTPAHTGVISPPVGQTCGNAPRDRNFGDFFTATIDPEGKLVATWSQDTGSPESTRTIVARER